MMFDVAMVEEEVGLVERERGLIEREKRGGGLRFCFVRFKCANYG